MKNIKLMVLSVVVLSLASSGMAERFISRLPGRGGPDSIYACYWMNGPKTGDPGEGGFVDPDASIIGEDVYIGFSAEVRNKATIKGHARVSGVCIVGDRFFTECCG